MERGHCSRQFQEKGLGSPEVTFEQSPVGRKGVNHVGLWRRVFQGEGTSNAEILACVRTSTLETSVTGAE